jgi:hypothetical protein
MRDWLGFARIVPPAVPMIQREQQFVENLHAYTLPRTVAPNSRVRDLVDMALLIQSGTLQSDRVVQALHATLDLRRPTQFPRPSILLQRVGMHHLRGWRRSAASNSPLATHSESCLNSIWLSESDSIHRDRARRDLITRTDTATNKSNTSRKRLPNLDFKSSKPKPRRRSFWRASLPQRSVPGSSNIGVGYFSASFRAKRQVDNRLSCCGFGPLRRFKARNEKAAGVESKWRFCPPPAAILPVYRPLNLRGHKAARQAPVRSPAEWPLARFSWLTDHGRVTIALAMPVATLQLPR